MSSWGLWGLDEPHRIAGVGIPPPPPGESYSPPGVVPTRVADPYSGLEVPEHPDGPEGLWHGTPSGDLRGAHYGLHVGTYRAAAEALEARIGKPAEGHWDGTRVYGETPVVSSGAGYGLGPFGDPARVENPYEPHLPTGTATFSDGTPVPLHFKPAIMPVRIKGPMSNTPLDAYDDDWGTNRLMTRQLKRAKDPSKIPGHYYINRGEDDGSVSAVVPHANHLEVLDPNWPGHRTAATDGPLWGLHTAADASGEYTEHWVWPGASQEPDLHLHPAELRAYARRGNRFSPKTLNNLKRDIARDGVLHPVIIQTDGKKAAVADGHHRIMAALALGLDSVPVWVEHDKHAEGHRVRPGLANWLASGGQPREQGWHLQPDDTDGIRYAAVDHLMVPIEHLLPHAMYDLVAATDADYFPDLVADLKQHGPKMPVTMETDGHLGLLADGTHRLAAAREAGLTHLPVRFLRESTRNLSRWGGEPLHDSIRAHLSENPHKIHDQLDRQPSWQQGEYDGIRYAHVVEADVAEDLQRLAMPAPLPRGITFHYHDGSDPDRLKAALAGSEYSRKRILPSGPTVTAHLPDGRSVGNIQWFPKDHPQVIQGVAEHGEVSYIWVDEDQRRSNIGTALFDEARKNDLAVHHSTTHTPLGLQWVKHEQGRRTAMPQPLPKGVYFRYHPELVWSPGVTAHLPGGRQVGSLEWYDDDHVMVDLGTRRPGEIDRIQVPEDQRGQSIATSMFDFAKQHEPRLHHSEQLTEDGRGWSEYEKARNARLAAVNQDLVDRLHDEFHQWWHDTGQTPHAGADPERGPIGHWPHIEQFLFEKYPMAHLGLDMGMEEVGATLDSHPPKYLTLGGEQPSYETGPEAVAKYGYDPAEIAAGMVLLHNKSHPLRGDLAEDDQNRLNDIFQKRVKMQRDYEQRQQPVTARLAMAWQDWAPHIQGESYEEYGVKPPVCAPGQCSYDRENANNYKINHGDGESGITFGHYRDDDGNPYIGVIGLATDEDHRNDGVAESLIRRVHQDHPGIRIDPGWMTEMGQGFHDRMLDKEPDARRVVNAARLAGKNGDLPPLTFEPFDTMWSNGIMARHAEDGRPVGHLHWLPRGEIDSITVHPELQRRGIGTAMLEHARSHPDQYRSTYPIFHSQHLTKAGRAWAAADGHHLPDEQVYAADDNPANWGYTAVDEYVPLSESYNGQNEDEMSSHLSQPWTPPKTASTDGDDGWPVWWRGRHRPAGDFDDRWSPNHPQRIPAPWES